MRVILIGKASGRLDCLAEAIERSHNVELFILTNYENANLRRKGFVTIGPTDKPEFVQNYAQTISDELPTLAIISNEEPLANGVTDMLRGIGIATVGPSQAAAQIETSKIWTRKMLARHNLDRYSPEWGDFIDRERDLLAGFVHYLNRQDRLIVVKPDGLTGGKGVRVQGDHFDAPNYAITYALEIIAADGHVLIEQRLDGEEFSRMCFSDGITIVPMPAVQDHKRLEEGDRGINTGGMGSYSDRDHSLPFLTATDLATADMINQKVVQMIEAETGQPYIGVLYGNFIATAEGVKLIEYNARFGDPEVMNVLPLLQNDFVDLGFAVATGHLANMDIRFTQRATVCKYLIPENYPEFVEGDFINASWIEPHPDLRIYWGAVDGEKLTGSRALAVVGLGDTITEAEAIAERAAQQVRGSVRHRRDIGTADLIARRIMHMKELRP